MRLLADTNIFLEVILEQAQAEEAKTLLTKTNEHDFFISDYSLHSIGLLLFHRKQYVTYQQFVEDLMLNGAIKMISLMPEDMEFVIHAAKMYSLDFDDAYQYAIAEQYDLTLVSFDKDFDKTNRGRKLPKQILTG